MTNIVLFTSRDFKELRLKLSLTQKMMANLLHCSQHYIAHIEAGHKKPSIKLQLRLYEIAKNKNISINQYSPKITDKD